MPNECIVSSILSKKLVWQQPVRIQRPVWRDGAIFQSHLALSSVLTRSSRHAQPPKGPRPRRQPSFLPLTTNNQEPIYHIHRDLCVHRNLQKTGVAGKQVSAELLSVPALIPVSVTSREVTQMFWVFLWLIPAAWPLTLGTLLKQQWLAQGPAQPSLVDRWHISGDTDHDTIV